MAEGGTAKALIPETFQGAREDIAGQIGLIWELVKAPLIVPVLKFAVYVCLAMELMLFVERLYMGVVIILVKLFWKKPEKRYKFEPIGEDLEIGNEAFPVVLVQIPMFNEKEVGSLSLSLLFGIVDFVRFGLWMFGENAEIWSFLCLRCVWGRFTKSQLGLPVTSRGRRIVS